MKPSLSSFVYLNYPLIEAIDRMASIGYTAIDIWGGRPHAYRRDLSHDQIVAVRNRLSQRQLAVASFIPAQFRYPTCLCAPDDTIRNDSVAYIQDSIETASALGAPVVTVCPGHTLYGQQNTDGWKCLTESFDAICRFALTRGVRVAIEPADRYETDLIQTTSQAMRMINELGCSNLGIVLDSGHAYVVGEQFAHAVQEMGDRLFHVHVDDNNGLRDQHLVPGEGNLDFKAFFAALRQSGYAGYLCAELGWDYTVNPDPAARQTLESLSTWL